MCLVENLASCRGANKHGVQNTLVKCPSSYCDREYVKVFLVGPECVSLSPLSQTRDKLI